MINILTGKFEVISFIPESRLVKAAGTGKSVRDEWRKAKKVHKWHRELQCNTFRSKWREYEANWMVEIKAISPPQRWISKSLLEKGKHSLTETDWYYSLASMIRRECWYSYNDSPLASMPGTPTWGSLLSVRTPLPWMILTMLTHFCLHSCISLGFSWHGYISICGFFHTPDWHSYADIIL